MREVIEVLQPRDGMRILDATFGRGGHTQAMLECGCNVLAIDQDDAASAAAQDVQSRWGSDRFQFLKTNFSNLHDVAHESGPFDGILIDLGVSSPQLEESQRGFSFLHDGPLDMRMDQSSSITAADIVNSYSESELADLIWTFGEDRNSRKIAKAIVAARLKKPLETTKELADLVDHAVGGRRGRRIHPATQTFQAIRIAVNREMDVLETALAASPEALKKGGRIAVITFHGLEDKIVKDFIRDRAQEEIRLGDASPFGKPNPNFCFKNLGKYDPKEDEVERNPRSRSARLRAAEKVKE
jgi:16S rRNA (cytosine1402-N4)-methyltransferase